MRNELLASVQSTVQPLGRKLALVSINPDLKIDFGHFLNYEKRMNEMCGRLGIVHHCLANAACKIDLPYLTPFFADDSGHYCLHRRSAQGKERSIISEFHKRVVAWLTTTDVLSRYDEVILFAYMGSTRMAAILSCLSWPSKVRVVTNAFWDFLSPLPEETDPDLTRLMLQENVRHFAMSLSHQRLIEHRFGLHFPYIPHPPALASDVQFFNILRECTARKAVRESHGCKLFLPGLMTAGKGKQETQDLCLAAGTVFANHELLVRDRNGELEAALGDRTPASLRFARGDFTDAEIIDFYRGADIVMLPYSSAVFNFRTSAALVDCLMTGAVPVVFPDTWLADVCKDYDFGVVCAQESVPSMIEATLGAIRRISQERHRILPGAMRFMEHNSWRAFMTALVGEAGTASEGYGNVFATEAAGADHAAAVRRPEPAQLALRLSGILLSEPALAPELRKEHLEALAGHLGDIAREDPAHKHLERVLAFLRRRETRNA